MKILFLFFLCSSFYYTVYAQQTDKTDGISYSLFEGSAVVGYVDQGGFLNFTGPNISWTKGISRLMLGMLPSLRIKEDNSTTTKNATVFPTLGIGFAYGYKKLVLQLPLYYNTKTTTEDGKWNIGIGIGIRLNPKKN